MHAARRSTRARSSSTASAPSAATRSLASKPHRNRHQRAEERLGRIAQSAVELQTWKALEARAHGDFDLDAREARAETVVETAAERDVAALIAAHVEALGVGE